MIVTSDAVIVHGRDYGDTSRIVVAFTEGHGLLSMMAKGVRKPGSGMSGALEPLQESRLTIYLKPGRELQLVSRAEVVCSRQSIDRTYEAMVAGLAVCDVIVRTQVGGAVSGAMWQVVRDGLRSIDAGQRPWLESVAVRLSLAREMGFALPMSGDVGSVAAIAVRLSDGVVMGEGHAGTPGMLRMSAAAWRYIEAANGSTLPANEGGVCEADRSEVEGFLRLYVSHHAERSVGQGIGELLLRR